MILEYEWDETIWSFSLSFSYVFYFQEMKWLIFFQGKRVDVVRRLYVVFTDSSLNQYKNFNFRSSKAFDDCCVWVCMDVNDLDYTIFFIYLFWWKSNLRKISDGQKKELPEK